MSDKTLRTGDYLGHILQAIASCRAGWLYQPARFGA
jgi:hypothetical protein